MATQTVKITDGRLFRIRWKHRQIIKPFKLFMQIKQENKNASEITRTGCLLGKKRFDFVVR